MCDQELWYAVPIMPAIFPKNKAGAFRTPALFLGLSFNSQKCRDTFVSCYHSALHEKKAGHGNVSKSTSR